jgi:hypothetical protein
VCLLPFLPTDREHDLVGGSEFQETSVAARRSSLGATSAHVFAFGWRAQGRGRAIAGSGSDILAR